MNYFNIILISCLLIKEKNSLFNDIIHKRFLEENENNSGLNKKNEKSYEICKRGSDKLRDYYKTGDLSKIDIENANIECENKNEDYRKALIDITREIFDENENLEDKNEKKIFGIHQKILIKYFLHLLPFIIIFFIGVYRLLVG